MTQRLRRKRRLPKQQIWLHVAASHHRPRQRRWPDKAVQEEAEASCTLCLCRSLHCQWPNPPKPASHAPSPSQSPQQPLPPSSQQTKHSHKHKQTRQQMPRQPWPWPRVGRLMMREEKSKTAINCPFVPSSLNHTRHLSCAPTPSNFLSKSWQTWPDLPFFFLFFVLDRAWWRAQACPGVTTQLSLILVI